MLHASATSSATREVLMSSMRVRLSPRCTKASRNPVQESTSNNRSGGPIFGSIAAVVLRSRFRGLLSPSAPSRSMFSFSRPLGWISKLSFASCPASSSRSAISGQAASSARTRPARCSSTGSSRLRPARTSSATASSHCLPSSSRALGPAQRFGGEANTSRRFSTWNSCSSTHTTYASRSSAPSGSSGLEYTALRQAGGTSFWSISRGSNGLTFTFRLASAGSRLTA